MVKLEDLDDLDDWRALPEQDRRRLVRESLDQLVAEGIMVRSADGKKYALRSRLREFN
jgi:hypothetical protein